MLETLPYSLPFDFEIGVRRTTIMIEMSRIYKYCIFMLQIGFTKSKTTGAVDTSKVWFSGRRWVGPDKTFKIFDSSAQNIDLYDVSVFAKPDEVCD